MSRRQSSSRALAGWSNDEHVPMSSIVAGHQHKYFDDVDKVCVGSECIMWSLSYMNVNVKVEFAEIQ